MRGKPLPVVYRKFYDPTPECLERLSRPWIASYSGGKDSTSLVTWLEYLRQTGQIKADKPRLVLSDTGVEYPFLIALAREMMDKLRKCGWECDEVRPPLKDRLYVQIFGRGHTPIHPAIKKMRWCSRATKKAPMERFIKTLPEGLTVLTGVRWGESEMRDGKLKRAGCSAGGECGTDLGSRGSIYSPIINWTTCNVMDWLSGSVSQDVDKAIPDLLKVTGQLIGVYKMRKRKGGFGLALPQVEAIRFGCIGCPAVEVDRAAEKSGGPELRYIRKIYGLWKKLYQRHNQVQQIRDGRLVSGPVKMEVRKRLFGELLDIQTKSGLTIVTAEEEAFIRDCWERKVYPRGWSEADEMNEVKEPGGLL